jgi:DNA-binding NtrC family response regulator
MKTILVVDDEEKVRKLYYDLFTEEGFHVKLASNVLAALKIIGRKKIDVMLLDINMPEIEGTVLYQISKLFHKEVKIIVSSVYPIAFQLEKIQGAVDYYDKSNGIDELLKKVKKVLDTDKLIQTQ